MFSRLNDVFSYLFNIGIEHAKTISEQKGVRLLNQLVTICLTICIVVLVNEFFRNDVKGFLFDLAVISPIPLCFYFNKNGWLKFAKRTFVIFVIFLLTSALIFYGRECGAEYAYLVAVAFTFIFFLERKEVILFNILIATCFGLTQVYFFYFEPIHAVIHIPNLPLIASLICQICIVFAFVEENKIFDKKTQQLLTELSVKNKELDSQKRLTDDKNKALIKVNKELESFAYATSHDLRSPLRNIVSFIDLFNHKEGHTISKKGKEYLGFIDKSARHMNQLVDDILTHASLNSEEVIETVDLNKVVKKVCENLLDVTSERTMIESEILPKLNANPIKMQLLFQNIIENGIKYNKNEDPRIKISLEENEERVGIRIRDNGIGIDQKYHAQIFQMFKRLHGQLEYKGTGIGLATCKKIVESYGGKIEIEEPISKGTTFVVYFPNSMKILTEMN